MKLMKVPSCLTRRLLCLLFLLLYCLVAVQPQSNGGHLFLVISNSSGIVEPMEARYMNVSSSDQCGCVIAESTDLMAGAFQDRVAKCNGSREGYGVGVCTSVFASFSSGSYQVNATRTEDTLNNHTFADWERLCERVEEVREDLLRFQRILDRTLVCVYALSCEEKSVCLNAYKEWLCATRLPLFVENDSNSSDSIMGRDGRSYVRKKPCLDVCREVTKNCPYFLPSSYQSDRKDDLDNAFVYGGHPAFACPGTVTNGSSYSTDNCLNIRSASGAHSSLAGTHLDSLWHLLTLLVCLIVAIVVR